MAAARTHSWQIKWDWRGLASGRGKCYIDLLEVRIITSTELEVPACVPEVFVPIYAHFEYIWVKGRNV